MDNREEFLKNCIPLDTETTSLSFAVAEVIELGFALKFEKHWEVISNLYKPVDTEISHEVSAITNITQKMVENKPYFGKQIEGDLNIILDTIVGTGNLVAHNAFYDSKVMEKYPMRDIGSPWLCTLRMAKKLYADDETVTQYNLPYLRYRFELDIPEHMAHHRAGADAFMTGLLLEHLVDEMVRQEIILKDEPYKEQIEEWLEKPVTIDKMPFGKHKGKKLTEIPLSYWKWALQNLDSLDEDKDGYDKDFAASVALAIEELI